MTGYRDLAPDIFRKRLLIEAFWTIDVDAERVRTALVDLAAHLGLRTYGEPVVFSPATGMGQAGNAGWDAFLPLVDSGISGYFWAEQQFLSIVLYTCADFDSTAAVAFIEEQFGVVGDIATHEF